MSKNNDNQPRNHLMLAVPERHREEAEGLLADLQHHYAESQISDRVHRYEIIMHALRILHQREIGGAK